MSTIAVRVRVAFVFGLAVTSAVVISASQAAKLSPTAKAEVVVGDQKFVFELGGCRVETNSFSIMLGDIMKGEHFELNVPHVGRAGEPGAVKPTKDGTYTSASLIVVRKAGASDRLRWSAGGRTAGEADLTVTLKNNRRAGEFSGRTDGTARLSIKGTFTC